MTRAERAAGLKSSCNCCQAVLLAHEDILPLKGVQLMALGSTFGSGMGGMKGTCGALVGAEMVLGILGYSGSSMNKYSRVLFNSFEEKCGSTVCAEIKGVGTGKVLCSCEDCCRRATEALNEIIKTE